MGTFESDPVGSVSTDAIRQRLYRATAPFRGYGMERLPGLRSAYRNVYGALTRKGLHEINLGYMSLLADYSDMSIVPSLRLTRKYEATFSEALDDLILPGHTVVDVGAHIGYHTVRFARRAGTGGTVVAYEPERLLFSLLSTNVLRNHVGDSTVVYRAAVDAQEGKSELWRNGDNTGGASLSRECVEGISGSEPVEVVSLDCRFHNEGDHTRSVDLVKIDVQGHEAHVIAGAARLIERDRATMAFEYNPSQLNGAGSSPEALLDGLLNADYSLYVADEYDHTVRPLAAEAIHKWCVSEKPDGSSGFVNVIALHESRDPWTR